MKIDIHTHTRKTKKGDPATREISATEFCERVSDTDVGIIAITNHNVFDLVQYEEIRRCIGIGVQVWPGVELDVLDGEGPGHLLVIVSPDFAAEFNQATRQLTDGSTPDEFSASISRVLETFDELGPLYVAHYRQKKPNLSESALEELLTGTRKPSMVIKEVTNAISAGIYISHGYASIYGSDVRDWANYQEHARDLPDLRLPVESFEHFCLLLEKDATTINTALQRKTPEQLQLQPFEDGTFLKLTFYNDINVIFGAKGTGKSCILKAIEQYYASNGVDARVFESGGDKLKEVCDLKGRDLQIDLTSYGVHDCADEIESLRAATEQDVTALSKYLHYFSIQSTNKNAKRLRLKDVDPEEEGPSRRDFEAAASAAAKTAAFLEFLRSDAAIGEELQEADRDDLERLLSGLLRSLRQRAWDRFAAWKEITLLNSAVETLRREVARKTGNPPKPTKTGFRDYATNRLMVERDAVAIVQGMKTRLPIEVEVIGSLGENKGELSLRTEFLFQNGDLRDGSFAPISKVRKGTQKDFAAAVQKIRVQAYREDLFEQIASLNDIEDIEGIKSLSDLLQFKRHFALDGRPYVPSSGEAAMVLLERELRRDADIYILDEPERSLGNEYISEVIVPLIKGHALAGKRVFISTHDANIAVRTLPYCSVYRAHDLDGYTTYVGNPFSNHLLNVEDQEDMLDWRVMSMRTLEGGQTAFGERSRIYGKT
jgi:predicted ATPase